MGSLVGEAIRQDAISLSHLQELSQPIESAEPRRDFVALTLSYIQVSPPPPPLSLVPLHSSGRFGGLSFCSICAQPPV